MKEQLVYKIRHRPTGLFYQNKKGRWAHQTTHLNIKGGKIYSKKPKLDDIKHQITISLSLLKKFEDKLNTRIKKNYCNENTLLEFIESDWEIVSYKLIEIKE